MSTKDTVLSLDLGQEDCLYRILREDSLLKIIVYVHLRQLDLIPEDSRTYGPMYCSSWILKTERMVQLVGDSRHLPGRGLC